MTPGIFAVLERCGAIVFFKGTDKKWDVAVAYSLADILNRHMGIEKEVFCCLHADFFQGFNGCMVGMLFEQAA